MAQNPLCVSGEVPFKRLLWWHFFIISQLEVQRQSGGGWGGGGGGKQSNSNSRQTQRPACLYFVNTFTSWASVIHTFVCLCFRGYNHMLWQWRPQYFKSTHLKLSGDLWAMFFPFLMRFTSLIILLRFISGQTNWPLIFTGCSLFGLISLIPIDSFHMGRLSECVYFDQWVQWVNTNVCYLFPASASPY